MLPKELRKLSSSFAAHSATKLARLCTSQDFALCMSTSKNPRLDGSSSLLKAIAGCCVLYQEKGESVADLHI